LPIPKYQEILHPFLQFLSDEKNRTISEITEYLSKKFQLTDREKNQLKPSGGQELFKNRVGWARFYLKKSGLIEKLPNNNIRITKNGLIFFQSHASSFDNKVLMNIPQFSEFMKKLPRKETIKKFPEFD
jgi:restriction system protein